MSSARAAAALLLLLSGAAAAQPDPDAALPSAEDSIDPDAGLARQAADRLSTDSDARKVLARRILRSSLADQLGGAGGTPQEAEAQVADWVREHPDDAAHLALGFARDDRTGGRDFDVSLHERVRRTLQLNPERNKGILGALGAAGRQSKAILKLNRGQSEEEQREQMKRLFEGQGAESDKVLTYRDGPPGRPAADGPGAVASPALYDRLSEMNPTGYSPLVLALQSALNAQRPPGAPKAPETGKLDYATLVHPAYALRYDLGRQDAALRALQARAAARILGQEARFRDAQYADPDVQRRLLAAAAGRVPAALARRAEALDRARKAILDFESAAARLKDPRAIGRAKLRALSAAQKDVSRWLLVASLEGDLERLEEEAGFWTPELERLAAAAPAPEAQRRAFALRARETADRIARARRSDEAALDVLRSEAYAARWSEVERQLAAGNAARRDLGRDIALLARVPSALLASTPPRPRWRAWLESSVRRFAPSTRWARALEARDRRAAAWARAYAAAAAGDFSAAQRAAQEAVPGGRP